MSRISSQLHDIESVEALDSIVNVNLNALQMDGSWLDIEYSSTAGTIWPPATHLNRVKDLIKAYTQDSSIYNGDSNLYNNIINGLNYWDSHNFTSSNWWWNQIAVPKTLGETMILMEYGNTQLPSTLKSSLVARMVQGNIYQQTGANKLDFAIHYLYRACLTQDNDLMNIAVEQAFLPVALTTGDEGLQYDYSYRQHGPQLMIASYGSVFISGEYDVALWVRDTPYALSGSQLELLSTYYKDTYLKTIRGKYADFSTEGRGISRPGALRRILEENRLEKAKLIDPANNAAWDPAIARTSGTQSPDYMVDPSHTHFYRGDYTIHQREAYSFNVRTASTRTRRTEKGNNENLSGKFLPDGATCIQRSGSEYFDIMPIWEWDKIPGTTSRDFAEIPAMTINWGEPGSTSFVGGVSDSLHGVTAYDMDYYGVSAKKSWFFFDDEVVCLGAGINSSLSENTTTTLNQSWLNGDVTISPSGGGVTTLSDNTVSQYTDPQWVWHDSIGYFFPEGGNMKVGNQEQSGSWHDINSSYPDTTRTGEVFKLWFDHGTQPSDEGYAYIVSPGINNSSEMQSYDLSDLRIVENTSSRQAVRHLGLNMMQVVFHQAGTVTDDSVSITVDRPCIVMLKNLGSTQVDLLIADPAQQYSFAVVTLALPGINGTKQMNCVLPEDPYAGSTANFIVDNSSPDAPEGEAGLLIYHVAASEDDGNVPFNTLDNDLGTRWSAEGDGQWIRYDLGSAHTVTNLDIAWYSGDQRTSTFDVQISDDTTNWATIYSATTSGTTLEQENHDVSDASGRYIRIVGHGNSSSDWNSITEVDIFGYSGDSSMYYAVADAYVRDGSYANTNFGSTTTLVVKKDGTGYSRQTYLKFDLHDVHQPSSHAKLRLYCEYGNTDADDTNWDLYEVSNTNWTEEGLTWNNRPSGNSLITTQPGITGTGYVEWDITEYINEVTIDSLLSFQLVSTVTGSQTNAEFSSKEGSFTPMIIIENIPVESDSTVTISDAYVRDGSYGGTNYGTASYLLAKNDGTGYTREAYVKFDLSQMQGTVLEGELRMYSNDAASTIWELYKVGNNWTETGLTWNNAPTEEVLIGMTPGIGSAGFVTWDIHEVLDTLSGNELSLKIVSTAAGIYSSFASKESAEMANWPTVIYSTVVEGGSSSRLGGIVRNKKQDGIIANKQVGLTLYPNPVSQKTFIESEGIINAIVIHNINGNEVRKIDNVNAYWLEVDMGSLRQGVYFFSIMGDDFLKRVKVIKE